MILPLMLGPEPTQTHGSESPTMLRLPFGCRAQAQGDGSVFQFLLL